MRWKWVDMCGIIWTSLLCVSKRAFIRSLVSIVLLNITVMEIIIVMKEEVILNAPIILYGSHFKITYDQHQL